jgi:hypothetical protein
MAESTNGAAPRRAGGLPSWAQWNPVGAERPWSVGLEEEAVLVERDGRAANQVERATTSRAHTGSRTAT